jgi:hypothetical protein
MKSKPSKEITIAMLKKLIEMLEADVSLYSRSDLNVAMTQCLEALATWQNAELMNQQVDTNPHL